MGFGLNHILGFSLLGQNWFHAIATRIDPYVLVAQGLTAAYNDSPVVNEALILRYNDMILREGTRQAIVDQMVQRSSQIEDADLTGLAVPTLLMWGKEDSVIPFEYTTHFEKALTNVTTAYYDDLGHLPMEEAPDVTSKDLEAFLSGLTESD